MNRKFSHAFYHRDRLYLTKKEFCFLLHIGMTKCEEEIRIERLKSEKFGWMRRIPREELVNWPRRCRGEQIPGEE